MKKELDDKLCKDFPNLYRDRNGDKMETCMCQGFSCDDGWYDLIRDLSDKLEKLILELPEQDRAHYKASQVKEKFGSVRFYMSSSTTAMETLIDEAEDKSGSICEECGKSGKLIKKNIWYKTVCEECEITWRQ